MFRVKIRTTRFQQGRTLEQLASIFRKKLAHAPELSSIYIKAVVKKWLDDSKELQSIQRGVLQYHFGLTPDMATDAVQSFKETWINSVISSPLRITSNLQGGFSTKFAPRDLRAFLDQPYASYISEQSGEKITWLRWLLLDANGMKIVNWRIMIKPSPKSRSGIAFMVKSKSQYWSIPEPFNVPPEYNFIRTMIRDPAFKSEINRAFKRAILGK